MKKILLWIVGLIVGLSAVGYVGVLLFFPAERVRVYLEERGSEALGQPVRIGSLSASFWGGVGVELTDALIGDSLHPPLLAHIKSVDVKLRFWSAVFGEYEIDHVTLVGPELALVYAADGTTNFDLPDDIATEMPGVVYQAPAGSAPIDDETAVLFGGLSLGDLRVRDGVLLRRNEITQSELTVWGLQFAGDLKPLLNSDVHGMFSSAGELEIDSALYLTWDQDSLGSSYRETHGDVVTDKIRLPRIALSYAGELNIADPAIHLTRAEIEALGLTVAVSGELSELTTEPAVDFKYTVVGSDLTEIVENVQALAPDLAPALSSLRGSLVADGAAQYQLGAKPDYHAEGAITSFGFHPEVSPQALESARVEFAVTENSLTLRVDTLVSGAAFASFALEIEDFSDPEVNCKLNGETSLAFLGAFLPPGGSPRLAGEATIDLTVSGRMSKPAEMEIAGTVAVANGSLHAETLPEQLERFDIQLDISPQRILIKQFALDFESSDLSLTGEINDPFPYLLPVDDSIKWLHPSPYLNFESRSHRLDIDKLFPEAAPGSGVNRASLPPSELPPLPVPQVNGSGIARIDTLIYTEIEFTEITSNVRLEKSRVFCENVRGRVYNGSVAGNTVVDLTDFNKPVYYGKFTSDSLDIGAVLARFLPWGSAGALFGKIKLDGDYASSGWERVDFMKALTMNLTSSGNGLELRNSPVVKQTFEAISQYSGKSYSPERYQKLELRSMAGSVKLQDGKIVPDNFNISTGQLGDFLLAGAIGIDGKLDLQCDFTPNEAIRSDLINKSGLSGALSGLLDQSQGGELSFPLLISGTTDKPVISIDQQALGGILNKALKEQGAGLLNGLFKKR